MFLFERKLDWKYVGVFFFLKKKKVLVLSILFFIYTCIQRLLDMIQKHSNSKPVLIVSNVI